MHEDIDPSQLLETYGGKLKLGDKVWPPISSFEGQLSSTDPANHPETNSNKYIFTPDINCPLPAPQTEVHSPENYRETVIEEKTSPIHMRMHNLRKADRQATDVKLHLKPAETDIQEETGGLNPLKQHSTMSNEMAGYSSRSSKPPLVPSIPLPPQNPSQDFNSENQTDLVQVIGQPKQPSEPQNRSRTHHNKHKRVCCQLI